MSTFPQTQPSRWPRAGAPRWGRTLAASALLAALLAGSALLWRGGSSPPGYETGPGRYRLAQTDYAFSSDTLSWRAGQRVTVTLTNDSKANPGKPHEFMVGRGVMTTRTAFGPRPADGFRRDFFDGVAVGLSRAKGVSMVMAGRARVGGPGVQRYLSAGAASGSMAAPKRGGGGGAMKGMPGMAAPKRSGGSGTMKGMPGMAAPKSSQRAGAMKGMPGMAAPKSPQPKAQQTMPGMGAGSMGAMNSFMVVLKPGGRVTMSFVVPRRTGPWEFACFQQSGQHYLNGMKGRLEVGAA